jgi:hypothetical protein
MPAMISYSLLNQMPLFAIERKDFFCHQPVRESFDASALFFELPRLLHPPALIARQPRTIRCPRHEVGKWIIHRDAANVS